MFLAWIFSIPSDRSFFLVAVIRCFSIFSDGAEEAEELATGYPWLIAHDLDSKQDDTGDQVTRFRCRIPELVGRVIRGCFHGWMILSKRNPDNIKWSLWNPVISKLIRLPRLILKSKDDDDDFHHCCLTSPPDDPGSILLLMRSTKPNIVFFNCKRRKRLRRWTEMSYSKQLKNISGDDYVRLLCEPTCCNGNIYAWSDASTQPLLIQIHIDVVKEKQVVINLKPLVKFPRSNCDNHTNVDYYFLKGSCTQLFAITLRVDDEDIPCDVNLFKLDMRTRVWTRINDLKDTVFFVCMKASHDLVYSSPPIVSELGGGYIHILEEHGDMIYSYNIKDKTICMSSIHRFDDLPLCRISIWTIPEFRLHGKPNYCNDNGEQDDQMVTSTSMIYNGEQDNQMVTSVTSTATNDDDEVEQMNKSRLLNIPFDILEMIMMRFCVGIEYHNFRATCKLCRLAAPMIQWSNERMRLQTYSLVSPWLIVIDKNQGIITFTDPMFGDINKYFIKVSPRFLYDYRILCSRYGWLLLYTARSRVAFFNPFTGVNIKLPPIPCYESFSFSAPPTSPDCMVVASLSWVGSTKYLFHHVGREPFIWHIFSYEFGVERLHFSWFPTFWGNDVYSLFNHEGLFTGGGLEVFKEIDNHDHNPSRTQIVDVDTAPSRDSAKYYHVKCDEHHLLVMVEKYGESVEVFKLNDCRRKWEKIDGLGSHMIYISDRTCVCMEAKIPEMENKIYFPRLHSKNKKIVFYSLETCRFHTFNGRNVEQNLTNIFGTEETVCPHAWIEPTWF